MRIPGWKLGSALAIALMLVAGGCGSDGDAGNGDESGDTAQEDKETSPPEPVVAVDRAPCEFKTHEMGSHGGWVIDFGEAATFHAEVVLDRSAGTLTVLLLDEKSAEPVYSPIGYVTVTPFGKGYGSKDGMRTSKKIPGVDSSDIGLGPSQFALVDKQLVEDLAVSKDVCAKLDVYTGTGPQWAWVHGGQP
jgi:hypothetical protein